MLQDWEIWAHASTMIFYDMFDIDGFKKIPSQWIYFCHQSLEYICKWFSDIKGLKCSNWYTFCWLEKWSLIEHNQDLGVDIISCATWIYFMLHSSFEPINEHLVWYPWLLNRPPLHRKQKFEEYLQQCKFSAGKWQLASWKIFFNIATFCNIVVCSFAIVNPWAIFFSFYTYVPIDKPVSFMLNSYLF
jgi:hypothetical protein